jgi:type IV secretion system protein TrbL
MKKYLFLLLMICLVTNSFANMCSLTPGITSGFDTILNSYANIATKWSVQLLPFVKKIFWGLFGLEFLYQLTFKKIVAFDIQKLYVFFVVRIFTTYMFAHIFLNIDFYLGIITYFTNLGSMLGGSAITVSGGSKGLTVSPSTIMNFLECQYAIPASALGTASFLPLGGNLFAMLLFAVLVLIISIPVALMIILIDAYVVIFGGFILCGFSGSSWTQNYWQKYLSYVVGVAIRLFVTCLILGLVLQSFDSLNELKIPTLHLRNVDTGVKSPAGIATYIEALFGLLFFNVVAMITIPNKAASMLNGSINGGLGEVIGGASMMMSGMQGLGGVKGAVSTIGKSLIGAPSVGKTAAISKAREILGNGANGNNPISSTDWKTQAKQAGTSAVTQSISNGWKDAVTSMRGGKSDSGVAGSKGAIGNLGESAKHAGGMSSGHGGASELNINPHKD